MPNYFVTMTPQPNGNHEVHREGCFWMPGARYRIPLGNHLYCQQAVRIAAEHYAQVNGCATCSPRCHTE